MTAEVPEQLMKVINQMAVDQDSKITSLTFHSIHFQY